MTLPSCVIVYVCHLDMPRYAQDGEPGVLASGQESDCSIEMFARQLGGQSGATVFHKPYLFYFTVLYSSTVVHYE